MRFVEAFPEFRAKQGTVSKHVTLLGEISNIVDRRFGLSISLRMHISKTSISTSGLCCPLKLWHCKLLVPGMLSRQGGNGEGAKGRAT